MEVEPYKLEQRHCKTPGCHRKFKVLESSPQKYCSSICEDKADPEAAEKRRKERMKDRQEF